MNYYHRNINSIDNVTNDLPDSTIVPQIVQWPGARIIQPADEQDNSQTIPTPSGQQATSLPAKVQGILRNCLNNPVYVWMKNGEEFWLFPKSMDLEKVHGYRWSEQNEWVLFSVPFRFIQLAICTKS